MDKAGGSNGSRTVELNIQNTSVEFVAEDDRTLAGASMAPASLPE
jgi:hypothetical protein